MASSRRQYLYQRPSLEQPLLSEPRLDCCEQWLKEIKDEADVEINIKVTHKSTSGEEFTRILVKLVKTLDQIAARTGRRGSLTTDDVPVLSSRLRNGLQSLLSERILSLVLHMNIVTSGLDELGRALLEVLSYMMLLDCTPPLSYPTLLASILLQLKNSTIGCADVLADLCHYALPMSYLPLSSGLCVSNDSMCGSSSLVIALECCAERRHQILLVETLMFLKRDVCTDLLSVVSWGSSIARSNAVKLFLHYWPLGFPDTTPDPFDSTEWPRTACDNTGCTSLAAMVCLDSRCATTFYKKFSGSAGRRKLYTLLCQGCHNNIHRTTDHAHKIVKFPRQLSEIKLFCDLREACGGADIIAMVTCYDDGCRGSRREAPIRMCWECHTKRHSNDTDHIYQVGPHCPWGSDNKAASSALLEAVAKLLDVVPSIAKRKESRRASSHTSGPTRISLSTDSICKEALMILYQYCTPRTTIIEACEEAWLVQLVALLLEWLLSCHQLMCERVELNDEQWSPVITFIPELDRTCSNYRELTMLVDECAKPWLVSLCTSGNTHCIARTLLPSLPGHAQVGRVWQWDSEPILRHQRTLSKLALLVRSNILPEDDLFMIYNEVMPQWMDLLVDMRSHPGRMEGVKQQLLDIFSTSRQETHGKRFKRFEFIRERFLSRNTSGRQQALFWLQDLSRLSVPVPYTSHIFEDSLQRGRSLHRHQSHDDTPPASARRSSTGSMSGYESESALVSQVSFQTSDTQAVLQLNFALPRYILMLDIWLSQLNLEAEGVPLEYSQLLRFLGYMLGRDWSISNTVQHTYHHDSTNMCLFCQAISLWFSFASRIITLYVKREEQAAIRDGEGEPSSPVMERPEITRRARTSIKVFTEAFTGKPKKKKASEVVTVTVGQQRTPTATPGEEEWVYMGGAEGVALHSTPDMGQRRAAHRKARTMAGGGAGEEDRSPSHKKDSLTMLYTVFQLCVLKKLNPQRTQLHPDAKHQIVQFCHVLLTKADVLAGIEHDVVTKDLTILFDKLWRIMECETSYLARSCVQLLLACQEVLVVHQMPSTSPSFSSSLPSITLWSTIETHGARAPFKTIDKVTLILQFMCDSPADPAPHLATQLSLGYGFCWLVQQLQSGDSRVSTRAHYCIPSLSRTSLEVIKGYLLQVFVIVSGYRSVVLQTLQLLNTALPRLTFLSVALINDLFEAIKGIMTSRDHDELTSLAQRLRTKPSNPAQPKMSNASVLSRPSLQRLSIASSVMSGGMEEEEVRGQEQLQCDVIALLLKYAANGQSDYNQSLKDFTARQTSKKTERRQPSTTEEPVPDIISRLKDVVLRQYGQYLRTPIQLRHSRVFHTFITHIHKALDLNEVIGDTSTLHPFLLRLLGYSAVPLKEDYTDLTTPSRGHTFTLGYIPAHLQAPWLRLFFVILYKYSDKALSPDALPHLSWCIDLIINTVRYSAHTCPYNLDTPTDSSHQEAPPTRRGYKLSESTPDSSQESPLRPRPPAGERPSLATVPEEGHTLLSVDQDVPPTSRPRMVPPSLSTTSMTSTLTSSSTLDIGMGTVAQDTGLCAVCSKPCEELSEEVIALCVVGLGTVTHRLPSQASPYLVTGIIPCIAKVVVPDHYSWQNGSVMSPLPGSAMAVARQFLLTVLTQFSDRFLFLYLFKEDHHKTIFTAVVASLTSDGASGREEGEIGRNDLTTTSPVQYLIDNACQSGQQFTTSIVTTHTITNLACYLDKLAALTDTSPGSSLLKLTSFDTFLKRLKDHADKILHHQRVFNALLRIIVFILRGSDTLSTHVQPSAPLVTASPVSSSTIIAVYQEFPAILEHAMSSVYIPVGSMVMIAGLWGRSFTQANTKRREVARKHVMLKLMVEQFTLCVKGHSNVLHQNMLSLTQTLLIGLENVAYLGYVEGLSDTKIHSTLLQHDGLYELHFSSVLSSETSPTGPEVTFREGMRESLRFLALQQSNASSTDAIKLWAQVKLTLSQLVVLRISRQRDPVKLLERIIKEEHSFTGEERSGKGSVPRGRDVHVSGGEHINALQVMAWLFLGTMSNNIVHNTLTSTEEKTREYHELGVDTTECEVLLQLRTFTEKSEAISWITKHVLKSITFLSEKATTPYWGIQCVLMFCSILTVYIELYLSQPLPYLVEFWQQIVDRLVTAADQPTGLEQALLSNDLIVDSFISSVLVPLKMASTSCYPLLLPSWRRVINLLPNEGQDAVLQTTPTLNIDEWLKNTLLKFTNLEHEYLSSREPLP